MTAPAMSVPPDRIKEYLVQMLVRRGPIGVTEAEVRRARPEFPTDDLARCVSELETAQIVYTEQAMSGADANGPAAPRRLLLQPVATVPTTLIATALAYLRQAGDEADCHDGLGGEGYRLIADTVEAACDALNGATPARSEVRG